MPSGFLQRWNTALLAAPQLLAKFPRASGVGGNSGSCRSFVTCKKYKSNPIHKIIKKNLPKSALSPLTQLHPATDQQEGR